MINRAHCRDDLAPALLEFLRIGKLESDAKNFGVLGFGQRRHLHDPDFVIGKEAVPFFRRDEIDFAAPTELRAPVRDVGNEHGGHAAFVGPAQGRRDVAGHRAGAPPADDVPVLTDLGVGMDRHAVHA